MSFSNAPDEAILGRVAGALAVDEAFVEKDWFVTQAIAVLAKHGTEDLTPAFSGGTALLKGHGLIQRFSEDIDFKLELSPAFLARSNNQRRNVLRGFRDALGESWAKVGFTNIDVETRDAGGFLTFTMDYPSTLPAHGSLRPHILAEISAKPPRRPTFACSVGSFVAQFKQDPPEVASIACVDPVETAGDKLSAFTWRMLTREREAPDDDPTIVRHLHDLAALEERARADAGFPPLLEQILLDDSQRGRGGVADLAPAERLTAMCKALAADPLYPAEYARFVAAMAVTKTEAIADFVAAAAAVERLSHLLAPLPAELDSNST